MTHLTSEQFLEAVEGTLSADRARHLEACETCRASVTTLRAVLADVGDSSTVPEPSPLFWDHLSRRVRAATAGEPVPAAQMWWRGMWRPLVALGALAGAVAIAMLLRGGSMAPPAAVETSQVVSPAGEPAVSDDTVDVVTAIVGDMSFDELRETDLVPSRSTVDLAVSSLTEAQQRELIRLVREEFMGSE